MRIVLLTLAALAGAALTTPIVAAPAADECLAKPKGVAPAGKHWYYNTDRKLQRKCWYLADEGEKIVTPRKQAAAPPADKEREAAQPTQPQTVDARAEFVEGSRNEQQVLATPPPPPAPSVQPQIQAPPEASEPAPKRDWSVASRWPEPSDTFASSPAPITVASAVAPQNEKPAVAAAPAPVPAPAQPSPVVADSGNSMDFGLIAGGLILLVVAGGTILIVSRRSSFSQDRLLRRSMDRDELGWPSGMAPRPAFPNRAAETTSRNDVIEEVEQLLAARRQTRESRAFP